MAITGVPPQDTSDYPWSNTGGSSGPGAQPPQPPSNDWGWYWWVRRVPTTCTSTDGELYFELSCERLFYAIGIIPIGYQFPTTVVPPGSYALGANPPPAPACPHCLFPVEFDFSLQDASGNYMPAASASHGYTGTSTVSLYSAGVLITSMSQITTAPYHYTQTACHPSNLVWNPLTSSYTCSTPSNIQVPTPSVGHWFQHFENLPAGDYTYTVDNIKCNGVTIQNPNPNSATISLHPNSILHQNPNWPGPPASSPCHDPKWYCTDWNCLEIMYPTVPPSVPPVSYWTMQSGEMFFETVLSEIYGCIGQPPLPLFPCTPPPVQAGGFSQTQLTTLGGAWYGFTTLAQMAAIPGVMTLPPTASQSHSTWVPLHHNVDDCINCCGGVNIPTYSNGTPNPYYGEYSTHPTMIPANQNAGFAAHLLLNPSANIQSYLATQGVTMCGAAWG